uniref:BRCT domain-containing protein n=1 Tax=Romanomermis culicivorax TaxID=13658 RepID=A0A915J2I5_ROMCU
MRAAEKFLECKTKFAAVPNSLSICDELIPDVEIVNASTGERSSKKRLSQVIQESGGKPKKGQKNEEKRPTLNVLQKLVEPGQKLISTFKIVALSMADPLFDQTSKSNDSHRSQSVEPHNVTPTPVKVSSCLLQTNTRQPNKSHCVVIACITGSQVAHDFLPCHMCLALLDNKYFVKISGFVLPLSYSLILFIYA